MKLFFNFIDNNIGDIKLSKIDCNYKVRAATLPVLRSVQRTNTPDFRIGFFADLHSGYANLFKVAALRQSLQLDLFASIGDLTEGGQYPAQLFQMIRILNDIGLAFNVIGNHFFDFEDSAIRSGTRALLEELKSAAKACVTNDDSYQNPRMTLVLTMQRLKEQLIQEIIVRTRGKNAILDQAIRMANFPFLSLNLEFEPGSTLGQQVGKGILPYYIHSMHGRRIAFIGVTTESLTHEFSYHQRMGYESTVSVREEPLEDQVRKTIQGLGADHIVLASHLGFPRDVEMASEVPEIDLVLGSHTHSTTHTQVVHRDGKVIPIVHTGLKGAALGIVDVNFKDNGRLGINPHLIDVESQPSVTVPSDFNYHPKIIGRLATPLSLKYKSTRPIPLMNFITNACRKETGADIALNFAGSVRDGLPAGDITESDLEAMLPWPEKIVVLELSGQQITDALQFAADNSYPGSGRVLLLHPSGFNYSITKDGKIKTALDPTRQYSVAISKFMAEGGIKGLTFKTEKKKESSLTDKELLIKTFGQSRVVVVDEKPRINIDPESDRLYNNPDITY